MNFSSYFLLGIIPIDTIMDQSEIEERQELRRLDFLEAIGIQPISPKKYGKERGANPTVSEGQQREITKLANRITFKSADSQKGIVEEVVDQSFDLLARPRVILYEGKVNKKSESHNRPLPCIDLLLEYHREITFPIVWRADDILRPSKRETS